MLRFQQQPNTGAIFTAQDRNDISEIASQICEAFGVALGADSHVAIRLSGAVLNSGNMSAGWVYWNREVFEVLPSSGLSINPYAVLVESNPTDEPRANYVNGIPSGSTITKKVRKIQFSDTGTPLFQYNQMANNRAKKAETDFLQISALINHFCRPGFIVMYSGSFSGRFDVTGLGINDYAGWALCNGKNGTPDLRGRFIVGMSDSDSNDYGYPNSEKNRPEYFTMAGYGGSKEVTLTNAQMPVHNHGGTTSMNGAHTHSLQVDVSNGASVESPFGYGDESGVTTTLSIPAAGDHVHTINNDGGGQPHENRPPYYVLAYVMKL